ncbi:hypothetical protein NKI16_12945 [Mesorhizobium sp. M0698]
MPAAEVGDDQRQPCHRQIFDDAQPDTADQPAAFYLAPGIVADRDGLAGEGEQDLAGLGQRHAARRTAQQLGSDFALEALKLHAHRRLRAGKPIGGPAHRSRIGHGDEGAQQPDVDISSHKNS